MNLELGRREKGWKFHKEKNLLKNNVLTGFAYNLYFKRNLSTSHCVPPCAKGNGGLTEHTLK